MNLLTLLILALGISMDAFAAALCKGAALKRPGVREAVRIGVIFGVIEMITPLIGWAIGLAASRYVMTWDHWIVFVLLAVLGGRMIYGGLTDSEKADCVAPERHGFMVLALTAVATSLDALAVGVGLAFLQVNIVVTALTIGVVTTLMATIGVLIGQFIGPVFGKWAEILGGALLVGIGGIILVQHLGLLS